MNLYLTADGRYVGTQAEAKKTGKGWTPETVPTDKEGLIEYLNDMTVTASVQPIRDFVDPLRDMIPNPSIGIDPKPSNPGRDLKLQQGRELSQITDYIMDSEGYVLGSILNAGLERAAQLNRKVDQ